MNLLNLFTYLIFCITHMIGIERFLNFQGCIAFIALKFLLFLNTSFSKCALE